jgi:hypothetical protein
MQHAIIVLTLCKQASFSTIHTLRTLMKHVKMPIKIEIYANPMVHPVTSRIISSYKTLMHDTATAKVWQMHLKKILGAWHKVATKLAKKG